MFITIEAEGTTSAQLRASLLERLITPLAQCIFTVHEAKRVTFGVAQYWDDNADDEVHFHWWVGEWPTQSIYLTNENDDEDPWYNNYRIVRDASRKMAKILQKSKSPFVHISTSNDSKYVYIDTSRDDAVKSFASCCTEGGTQNDDFPEPYTPYAVFRPVEMGDEDAQIAVDYLLEKERVPRGMFGDWELRLERGVFVGTAPRRVIDEVVIIRELEIDARASITTEIVGKVLRPEWEAVDASWTNPMEY